MVHAQPANLRPHCGANKLLKLGVRGGFGARDAHARFEPRDREPAMLALSRDLLNLGELLAVGHDRDAQLEVVALRYTEERRRSDADNREGVAIDMDDAPDDAGVAG